MPFELHPALALKTPILELPLCTVLLEDEVHYPWLILVPRRPSLFNLLQVSAADLPLLMQDLTLAQQVLTTLFHPTQLNVAAIGNKTPQLHVHVIARFSHDPAWPNTVWDHPKRERYLPEKKRSSCKNSKSLF